MSAETVTVTVQKSVGYSGKKSSKSYIARITGMSESYIFAREFCDTACADRAEMFTARRRGKGTWTEAAAIECGIYEIQDLGDRRYLLVWRKDVTVTKNTVTQDRAQAIALLLDEGKTFEEARVATKPPKTPAPEAQS